MQGIKLGMFPILEDVFPFMKPDWEDEQVKNIMKSDGDDDFSKPKSPKSKKKED
jgi:hypothetical protein